VNEDSDRLFRSIFAVCSYWCDRLCRKPIHNSRSDRPSYAGDSDEAIALLLPQARLLLVNEESGIYSKQKVIDTDEDTAIQQMNQRLE
jgi:hypothetical protein